MPTDEEWLTTSEAAELLGIPVRVLYRMIDDGALPAYRIGRTIRIRRGELGFWSHWAGW